MAGVDVTTVAELLGHKTLTMTLRYAHLALSQKVKAVSLLEETLAHKPVLLQKRPVIWYKNQFTTAPRSLETCHERSLPL